MKKITAILLSASLLLSGCGTPKPDRGDEFRSDELPISVKYNDLTVDLKSISFYEEDSDTGYDLYAVAYVSFPDFSEEDLYWMDEDEEFDLRLYLDGGKNDIDFDSLHSADYYKLDDNTRLYCFFAEDKERYSFTGTDVVASLSLTQKEKYAFKDSKGYLTDAQKVNEGTYDGSVEIDGGFYRMPQYVQDHFLEYFQKMIDVWSNID